MSVAAPTLGLNDRGAEPAPRSGLRGALRRIGSTAQGPSNIMFLALAIRAGGQAALTFALAHLLPIGDFADYAVIFAVTRLLAPLCNLGTATTLLADWAEPDRPSGRWLLHRHLGRISLGTLVTLLLGPVLAGFLAGGSPGPGPLVALVLALSLPVSARSALLPLSVSLGRETFFVASESIRAVLALMAVAVLALTGAASLHLWAMLAASAAVLSAVCTLVLCFVLAPDDRSDKPPVRLAVGIRRSTRIVAAEMGNGASMTADQLMVARLAGPLSTAEYSIASQLAAPLLLGVSAVATPHGPAIFAAYREGPERGWQVLRDRGRRALRSGIALALALTAAAPLGWLLVPERYDGSVAIGVLLIWAFAVRPLSWLLLLGLVAIEAERFRVRIEWGVLALRGRADR